MALAWAKIQPIEGPTNFLEITSEQLADKLQERELKKYQIETADVDVEDNATCVPNDTENDEVIAYMLQDQYNKEYNKIIQHTEKKFNRNAKVNITYANYQTGLFEKQEEGNKDIDDKKRDFDRFVSIEKQYASIPRCGYRKMGEGSQIVTKHDMLMSARINACRLLQLPPGIRTGDTGGFDAKLNNKVFNSLRAHSNAQFSRQKARARPHTK